MLKIRWSRDRLIFYNMGIPILIRQNLYIQTAPLVFTSSSLVMMTYTSYKLDPIKYACCFVVVSFVWVITPFSGFMWCFTHMHQGCSTGPGAKIYLPWCQWTNQVGYLWNQSIANCDKTQQSMNPVHSSWYVGCMCHSTWPFLFILLFILLPDYYQNWS